MKKMPKKKAKKVVDPSGDDKMVRGKLVDPSGDNRLVVKKNPAKKTPKKRGKK